MTDRDQTFATNLEYYKSFYYVALWGTITAAADALCLTQPTVTNAIQKLEEQLGCTLFLRTRRGMTLTAEGRVLWNRVEPACRLLLTGERELRLMRQLEGGSLSIASTEMSFRTYVLPAMARFSRDHPSVKVRFSSAPLTDTILDLLRSGEIDLAILHAPFQAGERFRAREIGVIEECFIAGPKYAFLARETREVPELLRYPFISVPQGSSTYQYASGVFQRYGLDYEPDLEVATSELVIQSVRSGLGLAMLPWQRVREEVARGELFRIPTHEPPMERKAYVITHRDIPLSPAARAFVEHYLPDAKKEAESETASEPARQPSPGGRGKGERHADSQ